MTHEEMLEEAARREAALKAVDKLYEENGDAMKQLAEIEKQEREVINIAKEAIEEYKPALEELAKTERPFYRFFAIEYFATGEGMSFWLKVCRNYDLHNGKDYDLERFVKFIGVGADHYIHGLTQPTQEEFMTQYANLIPPYIVKMIERRDQPALDWETHFYFNYS